MSLSYNPPAPTPISVPDYSLRTDIILVQSAADLPTLSGGYYPLAGTNGYAIDGTVALTSPITPNGATIYGQVWSKDGFSAVTSSIFKPSGSLNVKDCTIDGPFVGPAIELTGTGSEEIRIFNVKFLAGAQCALIEAYDKVTFHNCDLSSCGKIEIKNCAHVVFSGACRFRLSANPVEFSTGGGDITFGPGCQFESSNSGTYIKFLADGGAYGNVMVQGTMALAAGKVGIDGGETGGTPATFTSAKYGVSFYTNGGTDTVNDTSWTSL